MSICCLLLLTKTLSWRFCGGVDCLELVDKYIVSDDFTLISAPGLPKPCIQKSCSSYSMYHKSWPITKLNFFNHYNTSNVQSFCIMISKRIIFAGAGQARGACRGAESRKHRLRALHLSIWAHQFGDSGPFSTPMLTNLYRKSKAQVTSPSHKSC